MSVLVFAYKEALGFALPRCSCFFIIIIVSFPNLPPANMTFLTFLQAQHYFEKIDFVIHAESSYMLMSVLFRIFIIHIPGGMDLFILLFFNTVPENGHINHSEYFCYG